MMHPALDQIDLVEELEERHLASVSVDLQDRVGVELLPDATAAHQVGAIPLHPEGRLVAVPHRSELRLGLPGHLLALEVEVELVRHNRLRLCRLLDSDRLQETAEVARAIDRLAADLLVGEARLLAERGSEDQGRA